jgi:electron transport complex protein RnfC
LFERVITVTGKSVAKPSNFLARIGTPMKQLIDACGGLPEDTGKIIGGGPMMGKALINTEVPTAKGSSGILIMNKRKPNVGDSALHPLCKVCGCLSDGSGTLFAIGTCRTCRIRENGKRKNYGLY